MRPTPRYTDRPFPSYSHVPGRTPHPLRDPAGHSHGRDEPWAPSLADVPWRDCETYLYGVDLFNHRYWWECHEAFEGLWHAVGHAHPLGHALQAVIQCAVAHLKAATGHPRGAERLLDHARGHAASAGDVDLGFDLTALLEDTAVFLAGDDAPPAALVLRDGP